MNRTRVLISESHDPYFNLAVEDTIFRNMDPRCNVLFLWRNADTVVIGKGQNPWKECNTSKMEADGVKLVRRKSGGGAVFHDLGNTNFTFMGGKPGFDKSVSTQIVLDALAEFGIAGKATGRNDLVIEVEGEDRKFSGSAYRDLRDRGFHHGTLLLNADLTRLANYLNPDPKKLKAKGIDSVRTRVANLCEVASDISHELVCEAIQNQFATQNDHNAKPELISNDVLPDLPGFAESYSLQKDWDWNFGRALEFSHLLEERFEWGGVELHLDVKNGVVESAKVFSDSLFPEILEMAVSGIPREKYKPENLASIFTNAARANPEHAESLNEMAEWLNLQLR